MKVTRYIDLMLEHIEQVYFGTLTLSEENINLGNAAVENWLLANCNYFVANEDYGKERGRKHFHFIGSFYPGTHEWNYGYYNFKPIMIKNRTALAQYLLKLTKHTQKRTARNIIHSKNWKSIDNLIEYDYPLIELIALKDVEIEYKLKKYQLEKAEKRKQNGRKESVSNRKTVRGS